MLKLKDELIVTYDCATPLAVATWSDYAHVATVQRTGPSATPS